MITVHFYSSSCCKNHAETITALLLLSIQASFLIIHNIVNGYHRQKLKNETVHSQKLVTWLNKTILDAAYHGVYRQIGMTVFAI